MCWQGEREVTGRIKNIIISCLVITGCGLLLSLERIQEGRFSAYMPPDSLQIPLKDQSVMDVLVKLGEEKPLHYILEQNPDSVRMGKEIVYFGELKDGSNSRISKYFVCTDCHNQVLETDDPADESPERVLEYSMEKEIPFLPGATFYSMYNKEHWYNGDYEKKYGDLVKPTRDTLYNAIQLCATECSQGRLMEPWEVRCIMHYYKSLELKVSDLVFTTSEINQLSFWVGKKNDKAIALIKSQYNQINEAHFGTSEIPKIEGYVPSFENGKYIYQAGCLHCHSPAKDITNFDLSMDILSFKFLTRKVDNYNHYSIPHITRYGTYAIVGRRQYMPMYTYENMSEEQLLDLLHFVETKANE